MTVGRTLHRPASLLALVSLLVGPLSQAPLPALAAPSAAASTVTLVGDLQSELGCAGDWDPACAATHLTYDAADDVWQFTGTLPAGSYQYKAAINNSWDENYGRNAAPGGDNIPLNAGANPIKFYYDDKSHWITDNVNSVIAVAPGSFQSELGCPADLMGDSAKMNMWLHKNVLAHIAANGGNVPKELLD